MLVRCRVMGTGQRAKGKGQTTQAVKCGVIGNFRWQANQMPLARSLRVVCDAKTDGRRGEREDLYLSCSWLNSNCSVAAGRRLQVAIVANVPLYGSHCKTIIRRAD